MKRRILIFLTALLGIFAATVPSAYAASPADAVSSNAVQQQIAPAVMLRSDDDPTVITDACGNPTALEGDHPNLVVQGEEIDVEERASSKLLPINRWSEATSNFYTNIDEGMFSLNMERMTRENVAGTLFSVASTIWAGTTSTAIWATAFCPIDNMAGPVDKAVGSFGNLLLNEGGAGLITMALVGIILAALWSSRRGTGLQFAWKEVLGKVAIIALLVLMVQGAMDATDGRRGTGLSPANIVDTTNEVISDLATVASDGLLSISSDAQYAAQMNYKTFNCRSAVNSLNEMYRTTHMATDGAGGLTASIPLMLSNSWVETGYMMWMRAQFGPMQGNLDNSPQNHAACYVLDWSSGLPQATKDRNNMESRADLMGTVLRGGYHDGEFESDVVSLHGAIEDNSDTPREERQVNRIIAPESAEEQHKAMMFLSICDVNRSSGADTGYSQDFWQVRDGFEDMVTPEDCHTAWNADDGDATSGEYHEKNLDPFEMPNNKSDVFDELGQGSPMAEYVNHVNGSHPIGAVGAAGIMAISSIILFIVFGFTSLLVVLTRAALILVIVYLFAMALKALFTKDSFQPVRKAAMVLIGTALLATFVMMLYGLIIGLSSLMNVVGAGFMGIGSIPYLLWVTFTPGMAILLLHFLFKWAKLPSPMTMNGAKAWGKGLALDGGNATINATGGNAGGSAMDRAKRTGSSLMNRMRGGRNRADSREGSIEGQMKEDRQEQQSEHAFAGASADGHAEGSMAGDLSAQTSDGVSVKGTGGTGTGVGAGGTGGMVDAETEAAAEPTRDDKKKVAQLRRMEQQEAKRQQRAELMNSLKPRNLGSTLWNRTKSGLSAMKARGVRGNLRKAASTAAKVGGVATVAGALGLAGGLPLMAAGAAGVVGAKALKRRMEARGLAGRQSRDTFNRDVEAYVAAGRPEIEDERSSLRESLSESAQSAQQQAAESRAGQWAQDKFDAASDSVHGFTDGVKDKATGAKEVTAGYWHKAKDSVADAGTTMADTFKPAHKQSGATEEQKDTAYASRHGFDAHDPEQLAAAHDARIKQEQQDHKDNVRKEATRRARRARRADVKEHNESLSGQARSAREAMNASSNPDQRPSKDQKPVNDQRSVNLPDPPQPEPTGEKPQKPVELPDPPSPEGPSASDVTGKSGDPKIRPDDGQIGGSRD